MSRRPPPRRTRPAPKKNASWLPLIPLALLIVIGGLAIGAGISKLFAHKDQTVAVAPTPTPPPATAAPHAPRPVIVATLAPRITPSPVPTPSDLPTSSPEPTASPTPSPLATGSNAPSEKPTDRPTTSPSERPTASARPTERPTERPTPIASPRRTPAPPATLPPPSKTPVPAAVKSIGSVPSTPAVAVVQRYIDAIKRGDEVGAYAALGGLPGDRGLSLPEESFLDRTARVTSIRATPSDDGSSTVEVEIASSKGTYFSTFHVIQNAKGFVIDQHDFIKP